MSIIRLTPAINSTEARELWTLQNQIGSIISRLECGTYYETQEFIHKVRDCFLDLLLSVYRKHKDSDGDKIVFFLYKAFVYIHHHRL